MVETTKKQLEEAEIVLWKIFNLLRTAKDSKNNREIRKLVADYINAKISDKTKERGE